MLNRTARCLLLAVMLATAGCGYRLARKGPAGGETVAIPVFANKSLRPNLEAWLTARLVDEFAAARGGRVVPVDRADLELNGTILSYVTTASAFSAADRMAMYKAEMTVEAVLRQRKSGTVIWKGTVRAAQDYPVNADLALQLNAEEAAGRELCRKIAEEISRRSGETF